MSTVQRTDESLREQLKRLVDAVPASRADATLEDLRLKVTRDFGALADSNLEFREQLFFAGRAAAVLCMRDYLGMQGPARDVADSLAEYYVQRMQPTTPPDDTGFLKRTMCEVLGVAPRAIYRAEQRPGRHDGPDIIPLR